MIMRKHKGRLVKQGMMVLEENDASTYGLLDMVGTTKMLKTVD